LEQSATGEGFIFNGVLSMTIISTTNLSSELPSDTNANALTDAVNQGSNLTQTWATHYEWFPDHASNVIAAPDEIGRACIEICKAIYWMRVGHVYRDSQEISTWQDVLDYYKKYPGEIELEPEESTVTIGLNSDGVQLIARNQHILPYHPSCRVVSTAAPTTTIWNLGYHWTIRKGNDAEDEFLDGWYLDAEQYKSTIEGTLYYYWSFRSDSLDYLKYSLGTRSTD
jgi:hypothetical protein